VNDTSDKVTREMHMVNPWERERERERERETEERVAHGRALLMEKTSRRRCL
jgi:hypothetical protein